MNRPPVHDVLIAGHVIRPDTVKYNKSKELVQVSNKHGPSSKSPKIVKTNKETEPTLEKLKETLMAMIDIDKPIRSSKREIILVINIFVWLITFIALAIGLSSPHSTLRFV